MTVRDLFHRIGKTRQELSDICNVGVFVIDNWVHGREIPQPEDMLTIAQLADLTLEDIVQIFQPAHAITSAHQASKAYAHILQQLFAEIEDIDSFFFFCYALAGIEGVQGVILSGDQAFHFSTMLIPDDYSDMVAVIIADRHSNRVILGHENLILARPVSLANGVFQIDIETTEDIFFRPEDQSSCQARLLFFGAEQGGGVQ